MHPKCLTRFRSPLHFATKNFEDRESRSNSWENSGATYLFSATQGAPPYICDAYDGQYPAALQQLDVDREP